MKDFYKKNKLLSNWIEATDPIPDGDYIITVQYVSEYEYEYNLTTYFILNCVYEYKGHKQPDELEIYINIDGEYMIEGNELVRKLEASMGCDLNANKFYEGISIPITITNEQIGAVL
ncbi:MAG: hypothetical protein V3W20_14320 [Candidatus Neomarinimicrobiota bacterium]